MWISGSFCTDNLRLCCSVSGVYGSLAPSVCTGTIAFFTIRSVGSPRWCVCVLYIIWPVSIYCFQTMVSGDTYRLPGHLAPEEVLEHFWQVICALEGTSRGWRWSAYTFNKTVTSVSPSGAGVRRLLASGACNNTILFVHPTWEKPRLPWEKNIQD